MKRFWFFVAMVMVVASGCYVTDMNGAKTPVDGVGYTTAVVITDDAPRMEFDGYKTTVTVPVNLFGPTQLEVLDVVFDVDASSAVFDSGIVLIDIGDGAKHNSRPAKEWPGNIVQTKFIPTDYPVQVVKADLVLRFRGNVKTAGVTIRGYAFRDAWGQQKMRLFDDPKPLPGKTSITVSAAGYVQPKAVAPVAVPPKTEAPVIESPSSANKTTTSTITYSRITISEPEDLLGFQKLLPAGMLWSDTGVAGGDKRFSEQLVRVATDAQAHDAGALSEWGSAMQQCVVAATAPMETCLTPIMAKELRRQQDAAKQEEGAAKAKKAAAQAEADKARMKAVDGCLEKPGISSNCLKPLLRPGITWAIADELAFSKRMSELQNAHGDTKVKPLVRSCMARNDISSLEECVRGAEIEGWFKTTR
jgi:hypothetical protein